MDIQKREDLIALKEKLQTFSEKNSAALQFDQNHFNDTFGSIFPLFRAFPIEFTSLSLFRSRSTQRGTDFENIKQLIYPPAHRVLSIGRCHFQGQPIFYGSNNIGTSLLEVAFDVNCPCAVIAQFNLKEGEKITFLSISEIDHYRRHGRLRIEIPDICDQINTSLDQLDHYPRCAIEYVDAYLADYFRRIPNDSNQRNVYEVTARIANQILNLEGIDGLIYPSVRHEGGINFAITPAAFDSKFEIVKYILTTQVEHWGYGIFEFFEHASGTQLDTNGNLLFLTNPHFNARATIPLSTES